MPVVHLTGKPQIENGNKLPIFGRSFPLGRGQTQA